MAYEKKKEMESGQNGTAKYAKPVSHIPHICLSDKLLHLLIIPTRSLFVEQNSKTEKSRTNDILSDSELIKSSK